VILVVWWVSQLDPIRLSGLYGSVISTRSPTEILRARQIPALTTRSVRNVKEGTYCYRALAQAAIADLGRGKPESDSIPYENNNDPRMVDGTHNVTALLHELRSGNKAVESRLLELVYPELKKIARNYLRRERAGHSLQPTVLVNEAYMQLAAQDDKDWRNRNHFYAVAAQLMRRLLVDHARQRNAAKRDGHRLQVELTDELAITDEGLDEILDIDAALRRLAEFDSRSCQVVVMRFFGGMTEEEIADVLQVATRTVKRDWNIAKAWLHGELKRTRAE
jgi:RNA polymerase sigma-70 factor, ECF subfamily